MEESTAEATAATADTLKRELKKLLTEILSHGGGGETEDHGESDGSSGILKAIEEVTRMLNGMWEGESKKPESEIPTSSFQSQKVEVPKEFKCKLSNEIMIEPITIASGHTFEKRDITEWLKHEDKCPKTNEVLSHSLCTPNHLLNELITKWCLANGYARPKPPDEVVTELDNNGIELLLHRISSPRSYEDQLEAAQELRCQTNKFPNVRNTFDALHPAGITMLIRPHSDLSTWVSIKPELQENIIAALYNISIAMENIVAISQTDTVIPLLIESLTYGTMETRRYSASTLLSLFAIPSNKEIIGREVSTFTALGQLIGDSDPVTSVVAGTVVYHLCEDIVYSERAFSAGVVKALMGKIEGSYAAEFLCVLALLTRCERVAKEILKAGNIELLFSILRKRSCLRSCENVVVIVLNMCHLVTPGDRLAIVNEEEVKRGTFSRLTKEGSSVGSLVEYAEVVLQWLKAFDTGEAPAI